MDSKRGGALVLCLACICTHRHVAGQTTPQATCPTPPVDDGRTVVLFLRSSGTYWNNRAFCHAMGGEPIAAKSLTDNDAHAAIINAAINSSTVNRTVGSAFHLGLEETPLNSGNWTWHFDQVRLDTACHHQEFANPMAHGCLALDASRASGSRWIDDGDCSSTTARYGCNFYPSLPGCSAPIPPYERTAFGTIQGNMTHSEAEQYCQQYFDQGQLAYFDYEGHLEAVAFPPPGPVGGLWIGLKYDASLMNWTGKYVWASGETMEHCHPISMWEPDPAVPDGEMCYVALFDDLYGQWRYRQKDCWTGIASGALCRFPLCPDLPATPACMTTNHRTWDVDDVMIGAVMNYTCLRNSSAVFQTICQNGTATWSEDPNTFVCPTPPACPTAVQAEQSIKAFPYSSGSWNSADRLCRSLGGSLVVARTREENDLFHSAINDVQTADYPQLGQYWAGMFFLGIRYEGDGSYTWVDGVPFLPHCNNTEMGCYSVEKDCVVFNSHSAPGSRWFDMSCELAMSTTEIFTACQFSKAFPSCPANSTSNEATIRYILYLAPLTRSAAADHCHSLKAELASFHSEMELDSAFASMNGDQGNDQFWIGLMFNYTTGSYDWDDGTPLGMCDPIRVWEPSNDTTGQSAMETGKDCFKAEFDSYHLVWRYKQEDCSATVGATLCKAVLCSDEPPSVVPNARHNYTGSVGENTVGSVVTYKCLWNTLSFSTTCHSNGTWLPSPADVSFTCPPWSNSKVTMECFRDKALAGADAIFSTKTNALSVKKCSALCVKEPICQGIYLKRVADAQNHTSMIQQSSATDDNFECNLFSLGSRMSSADVADDQVGSKVCRHVYRDSMI